MLQEPILKNKIMESLNSTCNKNSTYFCLNILFHTRRPWRVAE